MKASILIHFQYQWISTRVMVLVLMFLCDQSYTSHGRDFLFGVTILNSSAPPLLIGFWFLAHRRRTRVENSNDLMHPNIGQVVLMCLFVMSSFFPLLWLALPPHCFLRFRPLLCFFQPFGMVFAAVMSTSQWDTAHWV